MDVRELIDAAEGVRKADLVIAGGRLVNTMSGEVYEADVAVAGDRIVAVGDVAACSGPGTTVLQADGRHLVPGLIDGHLHIECSKLSVTMFADAVVRRGTTSVVSALDQIYVVAGLDGVRDALEEAHASPLRVFWAAPFKVPYTLPPSTVGHTFGPAEHAIAQGWPECVGVWETVAEFVLNRDPDVLDALEQAARARLPVFGCAPMSEGGRIGPLVAAGIRLDHESYSARECLEKLRQGMYLLVRESSVAHFFDENIRVVTELGAPSDRVGFCTDDVTAGDVLRDGHLDRLVRMAIEAGLEPMTAIQMATINCAQMYRIDHLVGSISPGRHADVLLVEDLERFEVAEVVAKGCVVARDGRMLAPPAPPPRTAMFSDTCRVPELAASDLALRTGEDAERVRVLAMEMDRSVPFVRRRRDVALIVTDGVVVPDPAQDALYVTVVERYGKTSNRPVAIVCGFGLRSGAIATSAAPDDDNIVCVGASAADMAVAVNELARAGGGSVVVDAGEVVELLALPVGGIVADLEPERMAAADERLDAAARALGCELPSAFGYLMFLEITSIPDYAMTDLGLVDALVQRVIDPVLGPEPVTEAARG